jgi:hypothetical protein
MAGFENVTASLRRTEADLERQLAAVRNAIAALGAGTGVRRGRPPGKRRPGRPQSRGKIHGRRKLSAAARKAISDAQKARWAKQRAQNK